MHKSVALIYDIQLDLKLTVSINVGVALIYDIQLDLKLTVSINVGVALIYDIQLDLKLTVSINVGVALIYDIQLDLKLTVSINVCVPLKDATLVVKRLESYTDLAVYAMKRPLLALVERRVEQLRERLVEVKQIDSAVVVAKQQ